jgi:hypothetical protein
MQQLLLDPLVDPSDCQHGCNGDCERLSGSDVCTFICHPAEPTTLVEQWAERTGYCDEYGTPDPDLVAAYVRKLWGR